MASPSHSLLIRSLSFPSQRRPPPSLLWLLRPPFPPTVQRPWASRRHKGRSTVGAHSPSLGHSSFPLIFFFSSLSAPCLFVTQRRPHLIATGRSLAVASRRQGGRAESRSRRSLSHFSTREQEWRWPPLLKIKAALRLSYPTVMVHLRLYNLTASTTVKVMCKEGPLLYGDGAGPLVVAYSR